MRNRWKDLSMSGGVASKLVGDPFPRRFPLSFQHLTEEPLSCFRVSPPGYQDVENIAILIDCSPKRELLALNLHEDFVYVPDITASPMSHSNLPGEFWPELETPESDCLVGDNDSALGEQILDIPKAECESMLEPDTITNDLSRKTMTFVERVHSCILSPSPST